MLLHMKLGALVAFLIAISALRLAAQLELADSATQNKCKQYVATPLPPEAAQVPTPKVWPDCNSYRLYSGIGTKADYAAARRCAWSERVAQQAGLEPRHTIASVFGGSAMLTVLYTNGEGVPKDKALALRFACEADGAAAEISYRLKDIEARFAKTAATKKKFDFCDDITSGFMQGFCAAYGSEFADQQRIAAVRAFSARMSQAQREVFDQLNKLQKEYAHAHADGEVDTSGTARAMNEIDAEDSLRDDFLAALRSFESGKLPTGSAAAYKDTDAELNLTYGKEMNNAEEHKSEYGAVQPEGIRAAERTWLKYRDAWVEFAKLRYPHMAPEIWLTLLTKDRISVLNGSFCDMDAEDGPCAQKGDTWKPSPLP
jgi:uncharacterized protein YecT (DUF1311 family)